MKRRAWMPDEQQRLADMYAIGMPVRDIAERLGRNPIAVKSMIGYFGFQRVPQRYGEFVATLAEPGETFKQSIDPCYWVSDRGRVIAMTTKTATVVATEVDRDGYLRVNLRGAHYSVHRLVAFAFIGQPEPGQLVAHNNGIRSDNRAENLRWATQAENVADKAEHGTEQKGSRHPRAKADEAAAVAVKAALRGGATIRDAALAAGVSRAIAADISCGRTWRHVT